MTREEVRRVRVTLRVIDATAELKEAPPADAEDAACDEIYAGEQRSRKQKKFFEQAKDGPIMFVDADFDHLHSERNLKSVSSQLAYAYHHLTKAKRPCLLIICGIKQKLWDHLKKIQAFTWKCFLTRIPLEEIVSRTKSLAAGDSFELPLFQKGPEWLESRLGSLNFVYLSADATTYLEGTPTIEPVDEPIAMTTNTACIVGGLIDRNHYKGCCLNKANCLGIASAKLPIDSILAEIAGYQGSRVITIDQTCALLQHRIDGDSWEDACQKSAPSRRMKKE